MYVTSDIYDMERIAPCLDYAWQEVLVAGVGIFGSTWPGPTAAADLLYSAAGVAGLCADMKYGGYDLKGETRTRNINPSNLRRVLKRASAEKLSTITESLLTGHVQRPGAGSLGHTAILVGGAIAALAPSYGTFGGSFVFPWRESSCEVGAQILRAAAIRAGAGYGYYFVRDDAFFPQGYSAGLAGGSAALCVPAEEWRELNAIGEWIKLARAGNHAPGGAWLMRDLYEINLLSARHLEHPICGMNLRDWIEHRDDAGRLEGIDQDRCLWHIHSAQMGVIRAELIKAGVIVARYPHVYR